MYDYLFFVLSGYAVGAGFFGTSPTGNIVALGTPGFANNEGTIGAVSFFKNRIMIIIYPEILAFQIRCFGML